MSGEDVRTHMMETKSFLIQASDKITVFLDEYNTKTVLEDNGNILNSKEYIQQVFKQLRRMEVLFDEALSRLSFLLNMDELSQIQAEKTLFRVYQQCIMEFYSPRNDVWYEESRAVYSNQMSIRFHKTPPLELKKMFYELEPEFQNLREMLDYYDTKHQTGSI